MSKKKNETAIAVANQSDPFGKLAKYQQENCNVLLPVTTVAELPAGTALSVRVVNVRPDPSSGDVYRSKSGKLALHGHTLDQLAAAAGMTWSEISRQDDRRHPHYCEYIAVGNVTDFDGTRRQFVGTKTLDYREDAGCSIEGKDYAATKSNPRELQQARHYITELCASKAKNRAIRQLLQVRQGYTEEELRRPFVVPKLVPNTSDVMVQQMVLGQMTGTVNALFGSNKNDAPQLVEAEVVQHEEASPPSSAADDAEGVPGSPSASQQQYSPQDRTIMIWKAFRAENQDEPVKVTTDKFRAIVEAEVGHTDTEKMTHGQVDAVEAALWSPV